MFRPSSVPSVTLCSRFFPPALFPLLFFAKEPHEYQPKVSREPSLYPLLRRRKVPRTKLATSPAKRRPLDPQLRAVALLLRAADPPSSPVGLDVHREAGRWRSGTSLQCLSLIVLLPP